MKTPILSIFLFVIAAVLGAAGQFFYKTGAGKITGSPLSYFNVWLLAGVARAVSPVPPNLLNSWSFLDTNWLSDMGDPPLSYTNLSPSNLGDGAALVLDSTNAAWLRYSVLESSDGYTNLTVKSGSFVTWFAPG